MAIKRLLGTFAHDPRFLAMFADAARLAQARGYVRERSSGIGEGRLSYMAPEQLGSSEVSRATDVYACGVMLWEMLGNRRLRSGRTPERPAAQILLANVPPPSVGAAGPIDPALEDVVRRATANNPSDRFASALEMAGRPAARARSRRRGVLQLHASREGAGSAPASGSGQGRRLRSAGDRAPGRIARHAPRMRLSREASA